MSDRVWCYVVCWDSDGEPSAVFRDEQAAYDYLGTELGGDPDGYVVQKAAFEPAGRASDDEEDET